MELADDFYGRNQIYQEKLNTVYQYMKAFLEDVQFQRFMSQKISEGYNNLLEFSQKKGAKIPEIDFSSPQFDLLLKSIDKSTSSLKTLKRATQKVLTEETNRIATIYNLAITFLWTFREVFGDSMLIDSQNVHWLSDQWIKQIASSMVAVYLAGWLETDTQSFQTKHYFASHGYKAMSRAKVRGYELNENEYSHSTAVAMDRALDVYWIHYSLNRKQHKDEGTPYFSFPKLTQSEGRKLDLITLTWCDAYINGHLEILNYLYRNQYLMSRAADKRSGVPVGLETACINYHQYILNIAKLTSFASPTVDQAKQFVAASMMLHKLEQANHFHLVGEIAGRISSGKISPQSFSDSVAEVFWKRTSCTNSLLFLPKWQQHIDLSKLPEKTIKQLMTEDASTVGDYHTYLTVAWDEFLYDYYISNTYSNNEKEKAEKGAMLHSNRRMLSQDLLLLLFTIFPPEKQKPWSDSDFLDAMDFYQTKYPIVGTLQQVTFPHISTKKCDDHYGTDFYSWYEKIYMSWNLSKAFLLKDAREEYQKAETKHKQLKRAEVKRQKIVREQKKIEKEKKKEEKKRAKEMKENGYGCC